MIREDRELLTELARLNTAMAPLALCIMDGTASVAEQHNYACRLIAAGEGLRRRATAMGGAIVEDEVVVDESIALPAPTVELSWIRRIQRVSASHEMILCDERRLECEVRN